MKDSLMMVTTTLGSAAVIACVAVIFFSSERRSRLHRDHKPLHRVLVAVVFGLLSIYASVSAITVNEALCNCRNIAPLYAGIVGGPVAGIGAGLIGGLFRCLVYGGPTGVPCMLACIFAGVLGSVIHLVIKKEWRYTEVCGLCAVFVTELVHMGLVALFGFGELVRILFGPMLIANLCGMFVCMYLYRKIHQGKKDVDEEPVSN